VKPNSKRILAVTGVLLIASVLSGCSQIENAIKPPPTIKHVKISAKVGTPDAALHGAVKPGAPANTPLWEGAGVIKTKTSKSDLGNSWIVTLDTGDPYDVVVAGMATGFQNAGWQVASQDESTAESSATVLTVSSSDGQGVVTISTQPDKSTHIDYVMTSNK
jgi:hypothetical protein